MVLVSATNLLGWLSAPVLDVPFSGHQAEMRGRPVSTGPR
jgi:hypothetical protein